VWNKVDLVEEGALFRDFAADASLKISAKTGEGVDDLYREIAEILKKSRVYIDEVIPYRDAARVAEIRRQGQLLAEEYEEDGVHVKAYVPRNLR
jgi:GTP-binding protein HflX